LDLSLNKINKIEEGIFKDLIYLLELNLEFNDIMSFYKNALFGLKYLKKVCLFQNPIAVLFPESLASICDGNFNCKVFIDSKC